MTKLFSTKTSSSKPTEKKPSKRTPEKDAFVKDVLKTPLPVARSRNLLEFKFADKEAQKNIKSMKSQSSRFLGIVGRGKFENICKDAEQALTSYQAFEKNASKPQLDETINALEKLKQTAIDWLAEDEDRSEGDSTRQFKEMVCRDQINRATATITQLRNRDKLASPLMQQKFKDMQAIEAQIKSGDSSAKLQEQFRELDAEILADVCGIDKTKGGTSDVYLIKSPTGEVAYAFKTIDGESDDMKMPKGAGAAREVLMSKLCQTIQAGSGLNFGWPGASLANVACPDGTKRKGALIDGLKGEEINASNAEARKKVPPQQLQNLMLCNLATAQFDIKWDNAKFDGASKELNPYDGGAAMPPTDMIMDQLFVRSDFSKSDPFEGFFGDNMIKMDLPDKKDPSGRSLQTMAAAKEKWTSLSSRNSGKLTSPP